MVDVKPDGMHIVVFYNLVQISIICFQMSSMKNLICKILSFSALKRQLFNKLFTTLQQLYFRSVVIFNRYLFMVFENLINSALRSLSSLKGFNSQNLFFVFVILVLFFLFLFLSRYNGWKKRNERFGYRSKRLVWSCQRCWKVSLGLRSSL